MTMFFVNMLLSASIIALASLVTKKSPQLAGFIIALPISTMILLALTHAQYGDPEQSVALAKSIFVAIPLSLLFFVPFFFAGRLGWPFWLQYGAGVALLGVGYAIHRWLAPVV